jgi:hypothetical protein
MHAFNVAPLRANLKKALKDHKMVLPPGFGDYLQGQFLERNACFYDYKWLREQVAAFHEAEAKRLRREINPDGENPPQE